MVLFAMLYICQSTIIIFILYSLAKQLARKLAKPNYTGKVVWITGASSGIGEYLAYQFSRYGANLIISARNETELNRVRDGCADASKVRVVKLDMADFAALEKVTTQVVKQVEGEGMKLDVVVENAGISMRCEFKEYSLHNHLSMMDVNVNGPFRHIQCVLPHMIRNKSGQIVGITSVQGKLATAYRSSYAASKHAFIGILDSIRSELRGYGIAITNIMPGYVFTNISKNAYGSGAGEKFGSTDQNIKKGMSPEAFAKQAVRAIFRKQNEAQISNQIQVPVGIFIRNLCPDLSFFGLRLNAKNQTKAIKRSS